MSSSEVPPAFSSILLHRAGLCTTSQDLGRPGQGRMGVGPSGPMDRWAHRVANALLGNDPRAPALELTGPGAELHFLTDTSCAMAGGDLGASLDGEAIGSIARLRASAGSQLRFAGRRSGARVSVALPGGLDVPAALGSSATDLAAGLGGFDGRPLRSGQTLRARRPGLSAPEPPSKPEALAALQAWLAAATLTPPNHLRYLPEPEGGASSAAFAAFSGRAFVLSARSGRSGYRFEGTPLPSDADPERLSEPTAPYAIQLPPDGLPILLMADRNTTGGYPRLGHLAAVDQARAGQLWPGDPVSFVPITVDAAVAAYRQAEQELATLLAAL